jgi:hypothetical protein
MTKKNFNTTTFFKMKIDDIECEGKKIFSHIKNEGYVEYIELKNFNMIE